MDVLAMKTIWHYAVWKASHPFMWPACMPVGEFNHKFNIHHAATIIRGDVTCEDCLRMMGPS